MDHSGSFDDTIVAPATPPGVGAISVIRLSGKDAITIAGRLFPAKDLYHAVSHTLHFGNIQYDGTVIDEVIVGLYKAPKSYTGEHVIEISCHGSLYIQEQIMQACIACGARPARPGEFTQRAFLNGKLDLAQAEAVADLIASNTEASRQTALRNIKGGFSEILKGLREQLIQFSALVELELDFSQEDVIFADRAQLYRLIQDADHRVSELIRSFQLGNVIKNGVNTVIAGKPNAGKSTLLNALLNESRAIVSEIAGTTRDTIEETLNIGGILFRLIDTAGLRDKSDDHIEKIGMERTLGKIQQAGIVIYLFDVNSTTVNELQDELRAFQDNQAPFLLVGNKIDEADLTEIRSKFAGFPNLMLISAKERRNLAALEEGLVKAVTGDSVPAENVVVTNVRHYTILQQVQQSLRDIRDGLDRQLPGDLLSLDIRSCLSCLGEITGEITSEDRLDYIFSKFCIGK